MSTRTARARIAEVIPQCEPSEMLETRRAARTFAREFIKPRVLGDQEQAIDRELLQAVHDAGLLRTLVPRAYGGPGLGLLGAAVVLEEIAAASTELALVVGASMLAQHQLICSGQRQLQARFLPWFSGDGLEIASGPVAEPAAAAGAGSVYGRAIAEPLLVRRVGEFFVLNGSPGLTANAGIARFVTVFAWFAARPGEMGLTCFAVPMDSPGLLREPPLPNGVRGHEFDCKPLFVDVMVPAENVIGRIGGGSIVVAQHLEAARIVDAAIAAGAARRATELPGEGAGARSRYLRAAQLADSTVKSRPIEPSAQPSGIEGPAGQIGQAGWRLDERWDNL